MCHAIATQSATVSRLPRTLFLILIPSKIGIQFETSETLIFKGSPIVSPHGLKFRHQPLLKVLDTVDWLFYRLPYRGSLGLRAWGIKRSALGSGAGIL